MPKQKDTDKKFKVYSTFHGDLYVLPSELFSDPRIVQMIEDVQDIEQVKKIIEKKGLKTIKEEKALQV